MCNLGQERLHSWCRLPSVRNHTSSVGKLVRAVKDLQSNSSTATFVPDLHRLETCRLFELIPTSAVDLPVTGQ